MFKNIQNSLLIKQPLLWNTKIVSLTILALAIHFIFFLLGFANGGINFEENEYNYNSSIFDDGIMVFFSVLVSILLGILWLVYYFKNNALKSFYPKNNFSLFKEWLLQLFGCFLIITFSSSYFSGKDVKIRSYFSKQETIKRCTILSMGSYFVENSFSYNNRNDKNDSSELAVTGETSNPSDSSQIGYVEFEGKNYYQNSLINRDLNSYTILNSTQDSVNKHQIRKWLVTNQKQKITSLFRDYLQIAADHNLKASITAKEWTDLIYNYPNFTEYKHIGKEEKSQYYFNDNQKEFDSSNYYMKSIDNVEYLVSKYYVPETQLNFAYKKISDSYEKPFLDWNSLLIYIYVAFGISLSIFAFKVTSGKSWLIALVSFGVFNIISGIFSAIFGSALVFIILILALIIFVFIYLHVILKANQGKKISGITNALLLSLTPTFLPLLVGFFQTIITTSSAYYAVDISERQQQYPITYFIKENVILLLVLNLIFVLIMQVYYSKTMKIWRGIAED